MCRDISLRRDVEISRSDVRNRVPPGRVDRVGSWAAMDRERARWDLPAALGVSGIDVGGSIETRSGRQWLGKETIQWIGARDARKQERWGE